MTIPTIDPNVRYVGVASLRKLNAELLRAMSETLVIQDSDEPIAVLVPYKTFLAMQTERAPTNDTSGRTI